MSRYYNRQIRGGSGGSRGGRGGRSWSRNRRGGRNGGGYHLRGSSSGNSRRRRYYRDDNNSRTSSGINENNSNSTNTNSTNNAPNSEIEKKTMQLYTTLFTQSLSNTLLAPPQPLPPLPPKLATNGSSSLFKQYQDVHQRCFDIQQRLLRKLSDGGGRSEGGGGSGSGSGSGEGGGVELGGIRFNNSNINDDYFDDVNDNDNDDEPQFQHYALPPSGLRIPLPSSIFSSGLMMISPPMQMMRLPIFLLQPPPSIMEATNYSNKQTYYRTVIGYINTRRMVQLFNKQLLIQANGGRVPQQQQPLPQPLQGQATSIPEINLPLPLPLVPAAPPPTPPISEPSTSQSQSQSQPK